jgi:hypothetical protein
VRRYRCRRCGRVGKHDFRRTLRGFVCAHDEACAARVAYGDAVKARNARGNAGRRSAGVIVTMRRRGSEQTVSRYEHGLVEEALPAALARFDPEQWAVQTISTPRTILRDLQGRERAVIGIESVDMWGTPSTLRQLATPEHLLLTRAGAAAWDVVRSRP